MEKKRRTRSSSPIHCSHCQRDFSVTSSSLTDAVAFCLYCGHPFRKGKTPELPKGSTAAIVPGIEPKQGEIQSTLGPYEILKKIGQGGMGEVLLAYDTNCGRRLALKKIRADLSEHPHLYRRFLKEARITSQLAHPSIIPIYNIHQNESNLYYTMPYVEGETLKQILRTTRKQEKEGKPLHPIGGSIPALLRIFISICNAVSYSHSHGILHRDLKPENVMIGKFGEVLILDWGLSKVFHETEEQFPDDGKEDLYAGEFTSKGKVVGTVSYMPPERALGYPANTQTDIYALGVILYQLLALRLPFKRENIKNFKKTMHREGFTDPAEVAPYRDVPQMLTQIVKRCLHPNMEQRYTTVDNLLHDIENYLEGGAEWFLVQQLDPKRKKDWEFQENVLIAENLAITRSVEEADWFNLMISKASFTGKTKLEARVRLEEGSQGIGFLLSIPEAEQRTHINDGYCLWIGSETHRPTKLLCSTVEVVHAPEIFLNIGEWVDIRIEKSDQNVFVYLNNELQFSYISLMPMMGTHVGLLARDDHYTLSHLSIYVGNISVTVNCLAIPDAFLAHNDYDTAFSEYRRIGYSFPGRTEGRQAIFRSGYTLLEKAAHTPDKLALFDQALKEFERLHGTPGAPFEYLGKALVYQQQRDFDEEAKCFELALRRFPRHPLLANLHHQLLFRLHQSSRKQRKATYQFALLVAHLLPKEAIGQHTLRLFDRLKQNWEVLPYRFPVPDDQDPSLDFRSTLAFWSARPFLLHELLKTWVKNPSHPSLAMNIVRHLMELGEEETLTEVWDLLKEEELPHHFLQKAKQAWETRADPLPPIKDLAKTKSPTPAEENLFFFLVDQAIDLGQTSPLPDILKSLKGWSNEGHLQATLFCIWSLLYENRWEEAGELFGQYPVELLTHESSLLHFLYGCWLQATEGKELAMIHFRSVLHVTYPRSWMLLSHYLTDAIREETAWYRNAFVWETRQLSRQLALYEHCSHHEGRGKIDG